MKFFKIYICFFISFSMFSQKRKLLKGYVISNGSLVENVYVKNITTNKYSTSNKNGMFLLNTNIGDSLVFSHIALVSFKKTITKKDFESDSLLIKMVSNIHNLDEVVIKTYPKIDAVSLGIIPKKIKERTINEKKLYAASGGFLSTIINEINGKTKMLKKNIEADKKTSNILFLKNRYYDYMSLNLKISDENINEFLYSLADEKKIKSLTDEKNDAKLKFLICDYWIMFKKTHLVEPQHMVKAIKK